MNKTNFKSAKDNSLGLNLQILLNNYLKVPQESRNFLQIILWWEKKRIAFNLFLAFIGVFCILASQLFKGNSIPFSQVNFPKIITLFLFINLGYSLSCISELGLKNNSNYAPSLLKKGFVFCAILTCICAFILV